MKKKILVFIFVMFFFVDFCRADTISQPVFHDTYVDIANPTANYGKGSNLQMQEASDNYKYAYILFDYSNFLVNPSSIISKKLVVYHGSSSSYLVKLFYCNSTFNEDVLTWDNKDSYVKGCDSYSYANFTLSASPRVVDVTNLSVPFTFKLTTTSTSAISVYSGEKSSTPTSINITVNDTVYSLQINLYDELNKTPINNLLVAASNDYLQEIINIPLFYGVSNNSITFFVNNKTKNNFVFYNNNYYRTLKLEEINENTTINLYLIDKNAQYVQPVTFTFVNNFGLPIEGVRCEIFKKDMNFNNLTIAKTKTNVQGQFLEYFYTLSEYDFYCSDGTVSKNFSLIPTSYYYTVIMRQNNIYVPVSPYQNLYYTIIPQSGVLQPSTDQNFLLLINDSEGVVNNFGIFFNSSVYDIQTSGNYSSLTLNTYDFENRTIYLLYFINYSDGQIWTRNISYFIYGGNYSLNNSLTYYFSSIKDSINPLYRFIFALVISLIIGAAFFSVLGSAASTIIATGIFLGFGIIGFVSIIYPIIVAIIVVIGYIIIGGNEGT